MFSPANQRIWRGIRQTLSKKNQLHKAIIREQNPSQKVLNNPVWRIPSPSSGIFPRPIIVFPVTVIVAVHSFLLVTRPRPRLSHLRLGFKGAGGSTVPPPPPRSPLPPPLLGIPPPPHTRNHGRGEEASLFLLSSAHTSITGQAAREEQIMPKAFIFLSSPLRFLPIFALFSSSLVGAAELPILPSLPKCSSNLAEEKAFEASLCPFFFSSNSSPLLSLFSGLALWNPFLLRHCAFLRNGQRRTSGSGLEFKRSTHSSQSRPAKRLRSTHT